MLKIFWVFLTNSLVIENGHDDSFVLPSHLQKLIGCTKKFQVRFGNHKMILARQTLLFMDYLRRKYHLSQWLAQLNHTHLLQILENKLLVQRRPSLLHLCNHRVKIFNQLHQTWVWKERYSLKKNLQKFPGWTFPLKLFMTLKKTEDNSKYIEYLLMLIKATGVMLWHDSW